MNTSIFNPQKYFNEKVNGDSVAMHIYGIIGADLPGDTNNVGFQLVSYIKKLEQNYNRINIHINSPGGVIEDGLAVYNTIKNSKAEIHTYNDGIVGSMAGVIFLAGKVKHAAMASIHHIHQPSTITAGNILDHQQALNNLQKWQEVLINAYSEVSGMSHEDLKAKFFDGKEHMLTAEDAKALNFVDEIITTKINTNQNIKNLSYREIIDVYNENKLDFSERLKILFTGKITNQININKEKPMKTYNLKAYTALAVLLSTFELKQDEQGYVMLTEEQFKAMAEVVSNNIATINDLAGEKKLTNQLQIENESLKNQLIEAKKKLEKTPVSVASQEGAKDTVKIVDLNEYDSITRAEMIKTKGF